MRKALFLATAFWLILPAPFCLSQDRYTVSDEAAGVAGSPQVVVLRDNVAGAEAAVAPSQGGELSSYRVTLLGKKIELLYRARGYGSEPGFRGKAPLLWPGVGPQFPPDNIPKATCGDGVFLIGGKSYPMPCHGFAKNQPWREISRSADERGAQVTVELTDTESTRQSYPFSFKLDATYLLSNAQLTITYTVTSGPSNKQDMPFSIGNHIGFKIPFVEGTDPANMTLETPNTTQLLHNPTGAGLSGEQVLRSFETPQKLGAFDARVAIALAGYRSQPYAVLSDPHGVSVRVTQSASTTLPDPLVRFNIYGGPHEGYLCPEPWFGIQNSLYEHKGIVALSPGESWKWRLQIVASGPPPGMSNASPGVERYGSNFGYVEGPVWSRKGYLLFSDMFGSRVIKMTAPNKTETYRDYTNAANGNSMDVQGRLYSCERDGRRVVRLEKDGKLTVIAKEFDGKRINDPNDVIVRRDGQVYFTDPLPKDSLEKMELGFAGVYHVAPDGKITLIRKMTRPNGVTLTPDGKTLYIDDTTDKTVVAYDLDKEGNASNGRVLISGIDGGPDGLRVAANGNIYVACRGIAIYTPEGKFVKMIEFPEMPANCTFGDGDLRTLYVTARTSVYRVRVPDKGSLQY